jgi:type II secretory pathway pseudopilin PulG
MPNSPELNVWLDWEQLVAPSMRTIVRSLNRRPVALARRVRRSQSGELLVETMITVAIIGIAFVAVFAAVFTSLRIADYAGKASKATTVVRAFAESMKKPDGTSTYVPCTTTGGAVTYPAWPVPSEYPNYTATITQIRYLTGYSAGAPVWSNTCPAADLGLQELTLKVTGPINDPAVRATETVTITKRDARGDL